MKENNKNSIFLYFIGSALIFLSQVRLLTYVRKCVLFAILLFRRFLFLALFNKIRLN